MTGCKIAHTTREDATSTLRKARAVTPQTRLTDSGLDVRQLRAFVTLVDEGRMTAAAKALGVAQSTVSEALAGLARALGTPVIVRAPRGGNASVTPAGRALLPHARRILDAVRTAHLAVAAATTTARARLAIIANESVSTYLLPGAVADVRADWPNTGCSVSIGTCVAVREGIGNGAFDVGLMLEAVPARARQRRGTPSRRNAAATQRVVASGIPLVLFAKPQHPLARRRSAAAPLTREDVAAFPLFTSDAAGDFHVMLRRCFGGDRAGGPRLEAAGSVEGVKGAVTVGRDALGVLPVYAVADEVRRGVFVLLPVRPALPRLQLKALFARAHTRHPAVETLLLAIQRVGAPGTPPATPVHVQPGAQRN